MSDSNKMSAGIIMFFVGLAAVVTFLFMWGIPTYNVWSREMNGRAELAEAEWTKKVAIETAKAKNESAQFEAQAEITRAKGASEAQKIISQTLSESYLRYLWIQTVEKGDNRQTIYIPTEAGMPILESGRLLK